MPPPVTLEQLGARILAQERAGKTKVIKHFLPFYLNFAGHSLFFQYIIFYHGILYLALLFDVVFFIPLWNDRVFFIQDSDKNGKERDDEFDMMDIEMEDEDDGQPPPPGKVLPLCLCSFLVVFIVIIGAN